MSFRAIAAVDHGAAKINLSGNLDGSSGQQFLQCGEGLLESPAIREIEIDMAGVRKVDASALGMLLRLRDRAVALNRRIILKDCRPSIRHSLEEAVFQRTFATR